MAQLINTFIDDRWRPAFGLRALASALPTVLLGLACLLLWPPARAEDAVVRFEQADFIASEAADPPAQDAGWRPQSLPDLLYRRVSGTGWYRVSASLFRAPTESYAIYLPGPRADATLFVNGVEIGRTPPGDRRVVSSFPQVRTVPRALLHVGENVIHVRVTQEGSAWMSEIEFGPQSTVLAHYDIGRFWRSTAPIAAIAVLAFVSFFTLILWYRRPEESAYGFFGLAALLRLLPAARNLLPPIDGLPFGAMAWTADVCLMASIVMMWMFAHRYAGWKLPRLERVLWLSLPGFAVLDGIVQWQGLLDTPLGAFCKALGYIYAFGYSVPFVVLSVRRRTLETTLMAVAFVGATALAIVDGYFRPYGGFSWFTFRLVPLYLVVTWALMSRFARSLDVAEGGQFVMSPDTCLATYISTPPATHRHRGRCRDSWTLANAAWNRASDAEVPSRRLHRHAAHSCTSEDVAKRGDQDGTAGSLVIRTASSDLEGRPCMVRNSVLLGFRPR